VVESLTAFNANNPDRDLKIAGDTGVICRIDDQPIYRQTFYSINDNAFDELITHNNSDEIKEVQAAQKAMSSFGVKRSEVNL
jgi:ribosome biogenesis protein Tsr3